MPRLTLVILTAVATTACVPRQPLGDGQPCPCAPGWRCNVPQNICIQDTNPPDTGDAGLTGVPTSFTGPQVQAALARCDLPHGPPVDVVAPIDEAAMLVGSWLLCPPATAQPKTLFDPGIQFDAAGNFAILMVTGDGGVLPGVGLLSQGHWATSCYNTDTSIVHDAYTRPCPGTSFYGIDVQAHTIGGDDSPANCFVGPIDFESAPARAHIIDAPAGWCSAANPSDIFDFWMVPLP